MLQQTQVGRVAGFYENFIKKFPNFRTLAQARTPDVLRAWQGLGYNRRALALQKLAKKVVEEYSGRLPKDMESLVELPGIGPYTAGAIRAFAFNEPEVFIETNIRRVFIHFFFPAASAGAKKPRKVTDAALRRYIERTLDTANPREWYWALMDYGAMLGEAARVSAGGAQNPNRRSAHYTRQSKFSGSDRELRGKILRELLIKRKMQMPSTNTRISKVIAGLARDGFLLQRGRYIELAK